MISVEITDQLAEPAYVIEQLLIDATLRTSIGFTKDLFGTGAISCSETGEGKLSQQR